MALDHPGFNKILRDESLAGRFRTTMIDESHCISQWGSDFRKEYASLSSLRPILPPGTPIMAFLATMTPTVLKEAKASLAIESTSSFEINLGND